MSLYPQFDDGMQWIVDGVKVRKLSVQKWKNEMSNSQSRRTRVRDSAVEDKSFSGSLVKSDGQSLCLHAKLLRAIY